MPGRKLSAEDFLVVAEVAVAVGEVVLAVVEVVVVLEVPLLGAAVHFA